MSEEKIKCLNCKTENNSDDSYCRECGAELVQQDLVPEQPHLRKKTHKRKRIKTNKENSEIVNSETENLKDDSYSENHLSNSLNCCPICGTQYEEGDVFCKECGTKLKTNSAFEQKFLFQ